MDPYITRVDCIGKVKTLGLECDSNRKVPAIHLSTLTTGLHLLLFWTVSGIQAGLEFVVVEDAL